MKWHVAAVVSDDIKVQLLSNRDIIDPIDAERFLNPRLEDYVKSLDLDQVSEAQDKILEATAKNHKIMIYGDYDVDGICSSAIVYRALKSIGADVKPFIPHRLEHGYGLSRAGIDELLKLNKVDLLITVDNGIVAYEGLAYAEELGIEMIVTDHHEKGDKKNIAAAVVHTTEICGSGVAWCLVKDLVDGEIEGDLLQLAAVGTIADVMPMVGVNRALVVEGIRALKNKPNLGLKILARQLDIKIDDLTAEKISFDLIPKMNAAGRLDSAMPSLRMLCFEDVLKVQSYAEDLIELNNQRRIQTKRAIDEATEQIEETVSVNVVYGNWHPGIVGLVAARIAESTSKPTLAIGINNGDSRGSARSIKGISIIELLRERRELFTELGGHSGAAGFSIAENNIKELRSWLSTVELKGEEGVLQIDAIIKPQQVTRDLIGTVNSLEPFGSGNPKPILGSLKVRVGQVKKIGQGDHLKMEVDGIDLVGFGMGHLYDSITRAVSSNKSINIAYRIDLNEYMGRQIPQMKLVDLVVE